MNKADKGPESKQSLGPLIPPKRKISNVKSTNTISSPPSSLNIPAGLTGYAKIHLAKKGLLGSNDLSGSSDQLRLNGVV